MRLTTSPTRGCLGADAAPLLLPSRSSLVRRLTFGGRRATRAGPDRIKIRPVDAVAGAIFKILCSPAAFWCRSPDRPRAAAKTRTLMDHRKKSRLSFTFSVASKHAERFCIIYSLFALWVMIFITACYCIYLGVSHLNFKLNKLSIKKYQVKIYNCKPTNKTNTK